MRLRLESAATECELADCGMVSISTLVPSTTPSSSPTDHLAGAQIVTVVTAIEPDFIRASDTADVGIIFSFRIDDQRGGVARIVARGAAQHEIVVRSNRGTIRSAGVKRNDAGVGGRIEGALRCSWRREIEWIGHEHATIAGDRAWKLSVVTSRAGYWR